MNLFHFLEVFLIFIISLLINYFFDEKNLFYIHTPFNIYLYFLTIITLFYGLLYGFTFFFLYFGIIYLYYHKVNIVIVGHYLIFLLIFSEFMYYWNRKIEKLKEENNFLKERVKSLGNAYYLLKISHDELEKNYILKPYSIREVLREIRNLAKNSLDQSIYLFLGLLKKTFNIQQAALLFKENNKFVLKNYIGEKLDFRENDILVKSTLEYKRITFVGNIHNAKTQYLAVIPLISFENELKGIFIIKEMPFFSLTKDNLITIELFLNYFLNIVLTFKKYKDYKDSFLAKHLLTLRYLSKKFKIENYLVIFYTSSELEKIKIQNNLRGTDIFYSKKDKLLVILPFTPLSGVLKFCDKIKKEINIKYEIINLLKISLSDLEKIINE